MKVTVAIAHLKWCKKVSPRFELGLTDSKSVVLTATLWDQKVLKTDFVTSNLLKNWITFCKSSFIIHSLEYTHMIWVGWFIFNNCCCCNGYLVIIILIFMIFLFVLYRYLLYPHINICNFFKLFTRQLLYDAQMTILNAL